VKNDIQAISTLLCSIPQALFKAQVTPDPLSTTVMRMTSGLVDGITHRIDGLIGYFILLKKK